MQENYEHYISRNIKSLYTKRLIAPVCYLLLAVFLWTALPVSSVVSPKRLTNLSQMTSFYQKKDVFVSADLTDLKFTGYTKEKFGRTTGYFYYSKQKDSGKCYIVLLSPDTCEQGLPTVPSVSVRGKILASDNSYNQLLSGLVSDLGWSEGGIRTKLVGYYFSEPDFKYGFGMFLFALLLFGTIFSVGAIVCNLLYIKKPELSPPCRKLGSFGKPKELLALAEEELATLPQLATEDMFITEHFFIETSPYGTAIVPIDEIIWIYKHSTLHKLFWYHFSISYTLNITANKYVYIHCPKNIKSDIDGIIDYLAEANHNILVGFSEENRQKIRAVQGNPFHFERIARFFNFHK